MELTKALTGSQVKVPTQIKWSGIIFSGLFTIWIKTSFFWGAIVVCEPIFMFDHHSISVLQVLSLLLQNSECDEVKVVICFTWSFSWDATISSIHILHKRNSQGIYCTFFLQLLSLLTYQSISHVISWWKKATKLNPAIRVMMIHDTSLPITEPIEAYIPPPYFKNPEIQWIKFILNTNLFYNRRMLPLIHSFSIWEENVGNKRGNYEPNSSVTTGGATGLNRCIISCNYELLPSQLFSTIYWLSEWCPIFSNLY